MAWRVNFLLSEIREIGSGLFSSPSSLNTIVAIRRVILIRLFYLVHSPMSYFHLRRIQKLFRIQETLNEFAVFS